MSVKQSDVENKEYELEAPDGGWGFLIAIATMTIFITMTTILSTFGLLYNDFLEEVGMNSTSVTLLSGITALCYAIAGFLTSPMVKLMSMRKLALVAAIIFDLGVLGNVFTYSTFMFFICQGVMQGTGIGIFYNIACTMLNDYFVKKRLIVTSFVQTIVALVAMVSPILLKWSLEEYGYRGTLLLVAGMSLHNIVAVTLLQPVKWHMKKVEIPSEKHNEIQLLLQNEKDPKDAIPVIKLTDVEENLAKPSNEKALDLPSEPEKSKSIINVLKSLVDIQLFKKLIKSCVLMGTAVSLFVDTTYILILPQALYAVGWGQDYIALALSLYGFGDLAARILFVFASKWIMKLGSQEIYLIGIVLGLCSRLGMLWSKSVTGVLVYITVIGISHCCITILIPLVLADVVSPEKFTAAMGLSMLMCGLVNLILGPLIGAVRDLTNSYTTAFYILTSGFGIVVLFWSIELCYKRSKHKRQQRREFLRTRANKQNK